MAKNYVQEGKVIPFTAAADVVSGQVVVVGTLAGVSLTDVAQGSIGQLAITGDEDRLQYDWHQDLLAARMPQTIGGGIGQSRLAMLLLQKEHIGQVQVGVWPSEMKAAIPGML